MGRVPDMVLHSVVFMYPTEEDARNASKFGGSGFVLSVTFADEDGVRPSIRSEAGPPHIYIVTNTHVARQCRIGRIADPARPLIKASAWHDHPDGDDVSVAYLGIQPDVYYNTSVDTSMLATREGLARRFVGPGDDVYMAGRFVGLDEAPYNTTVLRRGVIALGDIVKIENPKMESHPQESFVVEMHSRSGFSGSPVFLDLDEGHWMHEKAAEIKKPRRGSEMLGITWGMFPHYAKILDAETHEPVDDNWVMTDNSGMELVVPAWKIMELLDQEEVVAERKARERQHRMDDPLTGRLKLLGAESPSRSPTGRTRSRRNLSYNRWCSRS